MVFNDCQYTTAISSSVTMTHSGPFMMTMKTNRSNAYLGMTFYPDKLKDPDIAAEFRTKLRGIFAGSTI